MTAFRYCTRCVMPSTRPDLGFDAEGVCAACQSVERKLQIDWTARKAEFDRLCERARDEARKRGNAYDCICAVSGGKDSTWIASEIVRHGLRPLLVSFEPTAMTPTGEANLRNIARFGDLIQVRKNPNVYRRLGLIGLEIVGDHEWPNHVGIFTSVAQCAVHWNIPVVFWGECPQTEYGAPSGKQFGRILDRVWLEEFGGLLGLRVSDLVERFGFKLPELDPYVYPTSIEIERVGVEGVFLGYYFPWDTVKQAAFVTESCGFRPLDKAPIGAIWPYENVDCALEYWHDVFGYVKFGYTRAHAQASIAIRHGHMSRTSAVAAVRKASFEVSTILDRPHDLCDYLGITTAKFRTILDRFVNPAIFDAGLSSGAWRHRFPIA